MTAVTTAVVATAAKRAAPPRPKHAVVESASTRRGVHRMARSLKPRAGSGKRIPVRRAAPVTHGKLLRRGQRDTMSQGERARSRPSALELEARFREITTLMYDTSVPLPVLRARVEPYLGPDVVFIDPWIHARGARKFRIGLSGFHCAFRFDFDVFQVGVQLDEQGRGRAMVDGVMNLRQLRFYTYPLRTTLVYDFAVLSEAPGLRIDKLEEMWSFADMIANAPLVGWVYDRVFRRAAGYFFTGAFWLACALARRDQKR
jgi:hypothetical protein